MIEHTHEEVERLAMRLPRIVKCDHESHQRHLAAITETDGMIWYDYPCGCTFGVAKSVIAKITVRRAPYYEPEPEAPALVEGEWLS